MKQILIAAAAGAAALGVAGVVAAQGPGDRFDRLDANGDGEISAEEFAARNEALIEAADTDGNGALSKEEMKAYRDARGAERRERMDPDKNKDGVVDRTEYINAAQDRFDRMDKNGDGVLSEDEQRRPRHRRGGQRG